MRQLVFGLLLEWSWSACGQTAPVADRVAKQNALFEEFYQTELKNSPERATAYGDYRYNSQLGQYSLAEIAPHHALRVSAVSLAGSMFVALNSVCVPRTRPTR